MGLSLWTAEQDALLKQRWEAGITSGQIARETGKSRNAVIGRVHRLKLKTPNSTGKRLHARPLPRVSREQREQQIRIPRQRRNVGAKSAGILHRIVVPLHEIEPVAIVDEHIPMSQRRTLFELTDHCCRWPVGEGADLFFCAAARLEHRPYCLPHAQRAYRSGKKVERTAE